MLTRPDSPRDVRALPAPAPTQLRVFRLLVAFALPWAGCGDFRTCPDVPAATLDALPDTLSGTGLYADLSTRTVSEDVISFTPRFPLWADGAEKDRWLELPEGGVVDASDMDSWRFPEGTRAWKAFAVDGVTVETRMLEKTGSGDADWAGVA